MTTNSPNPVDGDVQALISDCEREIMSIKQELSRYSQLPHAVQETISLLNSKLKRQQLALAALTADTAGPFDCVFIGAGVWASIRDELPDRFEGKKVYVSTAPPAQLLRPVDLGNCTLTINNRNQLCLVESEVVEALRQQGYEVKND